MADKRVTQQDIATELGLHRSTVSLALRNSPSIPLKTREQVFAVAEKLGYRPDPMLSALAAYRERHRPQGYEGTLAWLFNSMGGFDWRTGPLYQQYFAGAKEQAQRRGYRLEIFDINSDGMTPRRMASILQARNIQGILVCPQPTDYRELNLPWENFSAVTFGYTLKWPTLHRITATQFRGVTKIVNKLRELGYERIGFTLTDQVNQRTDQNYLAAYVTDEYRHSRSFAIPPLKADLKQDPEALLQWIQQYSIEVVVSPDTRPLDIMRRYQLRVPEEVGLASCSVDSADSEISGICENSVQIGYTAVDFLVAMIHRGENGIPQHPQHILVEGSWSPGKTVRKVR